MFSFADRLEDLVTERVTIEVVTQQVTEQVISDLVLKSIRKVKFKNRVLRNIAIGLIVFSFVLYGLLPVVLFLSVDFAVKAAISGGMMALSEVAFWVGGIILGKEIVSKARGLLNPCNWCWCGGSGRNDMGIESKD